MTAALVSKKRLYGAITSGGSESLIMSMYAYKTFYRKKRPNIVVPNTIHAAVDKGAMYFNIEVRKSALNDEYQADLKHFESLIDSNTIALYASYGNYPHGIIDPIPEIAKLAKKYGVGYHVDACLGGFIAAFLKEHEGKCTIDIDGVSSISLDHHKYALAPKGVACILYKTPELRHSMYYLYSDWPAGMYITPSFTASRPGFASAGAWYAMTRLGKGQYIQNASDVSEATQKAAAELSKNDDVVVIGKPVLCVIAFNTRGVDIYNVCSYLNKKKGWCVSSIHKPRGIHISVTPANCDNVRDNLAKDVSEAISYLKANNVKPSPTAAVYGASA